MLFRTNIIVSSTHVLHPLLNQGRSSTLRFGKRTFKCRLCAFEHELYERKRLKHFFLSLSVSFILIHSLYSRSFVVHEIINTTMIVFVAAAFTRPPEEEVVQVPEEKKRS